MCRTVRVGCGTVPRVSVGRDRSARYPPRVSRTPEYAAALRSCPGARREWGRRPRAGPGDRGPRRALPVRGPRVGPDPRLTGARRGVCLLPDAGHARRTGASARRRRRPWPGPSLAARPRWRHGCGGLGRGRRLRRRSSRSRCSTRSRTRWPSGATLVADVAVARAGRRDLPTTPSRARGPTSRPTSSPCPTSSASSTSASRMALVADAMRRGRAVVVAEPGTPDGYARVLARPGGAPGGRLDPARAVPPRGGLSLWRRATGVTSRPAWNAPPSTAASRAPSCPTRTRSSRGSQPRPRASCNPRKPGRCRPESSATP